MDFEIFTAHPSITYSIILAGEVFISTLDAFPFAYSTTLMSMVRLGTARMSSQPPGRVTPKPAILAVKFTRRDPLLLPALRRQLPPRKRMPPCPPDQPVQLPDAPVRVLDAVVACPPEVALPAQVDIVALFIRGLNGGFASNLSDRWRDHWAL